MLPGEQAGSRGHEVCAKCVRKNTHIFKGMGQGTQALGDPQAFSTAAQGSWRGNVVEKRDWRVKQDLMGSRACECVKEQWGVIESLEQRDDMNKTELFSITQYKKQMGGTKEKSKKGLSVISFASVCLHNCIYYNGLFSQQGSVLFFFF